MAWQEWLTAGVNRPGSCALELGPVQDSVLVTVGSGCGLPLCCHSYHSHCGIMAAWAHWLTIWLWLMPEMGKGQDQGKPQPLAGRGTLRRDTLAPTVEEASCSSGPGCFTVQVRAWQGG